MYTTSDTFTTEELAIIQALLLGLHPAATSLRSR